MLFLFQFPVKLLVHFPFVLHAKIGKEADADDNSHHNGAYRTGHTGRYFGIPFRKEKVDGCNEKKDGRTEQGCHGQSGQELVLKAAAGFTLPLPVRNEC